MSELSLTLSVGDRVVYPNQGVCRVSAIEAKEVAGQKLTFVTLHREEDGAVVMVPEAKVVRIGVRRVATEDELRAIFDFLRADPDAANLDWKQRARANLERMNQGGIQGLAEVVKGLAVLSEMRPLPTKERELYDNARHLLVAEIAASLALPECDAEDAVDIVLFPPGKERPKRTATDMLGLGEEDLDLGDDLLGIGSELELRGEGLGVDADEEITETGQVPVSPEEEAPPLATGPKKRGRPPKPKPPVDPNAPPPVPKKRGRPPKPKPEGEVAAAPKKRGRPRKTPLPAAPKGSKEDEPS